MNKIDKLLSQANKLLNPALTPYEKLFIDNHFLELDFLSLVDLIAGTNKVKKEDWGKYIVSLASKANEMHVIEEDEIYIVESDKSESSASNEREAYRNVEKKEKVYGCPWY